MRISVAFILIAVAVVALGFYLPWWIIAPICAVVAYSLNLRAVYGFGVSFLAVFITWLVSIYIFDDGSVEPIVGALLEVNANFAPVISALIGAVLSGIFGLAGSLLAARGQE